MDDVLRPVRTLMAGVADLVWPRVCPVCDEIVEGSEPIADLHSECLARLDPAPCLGLRFVAPSRGVVPVHALLADRAEWFAVLHRVKYGGEFGLIDPFVDLLVAAVRAAGPVDPRWVVVPVPDDPVRRARRGGSVVGRVAARLACGLGVRCRDDLVRRRRGTESQTTRTDDTARRENVDGVYGVGRLCEIEDDARLLIVDDQATSGATTTAVAGAAGRRGHALAVLVLARAQRTPTGLDTSP